LLETEAQAATEDLELISFYGHEYWLRNNLKSISLYHKHQLAFIIPANSSRADQEIDLAAFKNTLEKRFHISTVLGAGGIYPLIDMEKSLSEARIAIIINDLMGNSSLINRFSELGIYQAIFSQDIEQITEYCKQRLGRLIEHDNKNDGELLPTLRRLLDTCVNIKATADSLIIHVNTLYYRMNRIEQILEIDLAKMATRVELYTAIKVWDTLQILNRNEQVWSKDQNFDMALQA
jgi:DNA-binding PucR family transcriptional regulator